MQSFTISKHVTCKTRKVLRTSYAFDGRTYVWCWNPHLKNCRQARSWKEKSIMDKKTRYLNKAWMGCIFGDLEKQSEGVT